MGALLGRFPDWLADKAKRHHGHGEDRRPDAEAPGEAVGHPAVLEQILGQLRARHPQHAAQGAAEAIEEPAPIRRDDLGDEAEVGGKVEAGAQRVPRPHQEKRHQERGGVLP